MSMTKDSTSTGPPSTSTRSSCFLGCFGCSGEKTQLTDKVNSDSRRPRWISKWSFRFKKLPKKTVPVDVTTVPRKSKSAKDAPATSDTPSTKKHVLSVDGKHTAGEQKTSRKKQTAAVKSLNGSYSRPKETKPGTTSATGPGPTSPEPKTVTIGRPLVTTPLKHLTHSKSLSPPMILKSSQVPPSGNDGVDREFDSIIGMSIILVTLVIMVLWGKLCAILCTSAWFFVAPRLIAVRKRSVVNTVDQLTTESGDNMGLESTEYKKKVILEGLLQRNHRNVIGRL
ncbi:hypothetical protein R6Q57_012765 [Mikania cordata]